VQNKIDISKLVITKAITKKTDDGEDSDDDKKKNKGKETKNTYKVKQAHVVLAEKEKKRDKNVTVQIGDRISYVMVNGMKGSQNYDNA
jgi:DNA polymerase delta subunit 1